MGSNHRLHAGEGDSPEVDMKIATRGVLYVHSAPAALCPHVEWAISSILISTGKLDWTAQPAEANTFRTELSWQSEIGTGAALASALRGWEALRFEVTEEATSRSEGARFAYTPTLGIYHAPMGIHGDIMIPEDRIKAILLAAQSGKTDLAEALVKILGQEWDTELEPYRHAGEGTPVRWLHKVI